MCILVLWYKSVMLFVTNKHFVGAKLIPEKKKMKTYGGQRKKSWNSDYFQ